MIVQSVLAAVIAGSVGFMILEVVSLVFHKLFKRPTTRNTHIFALLLAILLAIYEFLNYFHR